MKRSHRDSIIPMILLVSLIYAHWSYVKPLLVIITLIFATRLTLKLRRKLNTSIQKLHLRDVDTMSGITFEHYVAQLLIDRGYTNVSLTEQYDYGVDIIAEKDGIRWGIQAKRYSGLVKAAAVRQVVTGLRLYDCDRAMVITNSTFSTVAWHLANGNNCILIDRAGLHALAR
ncbi:restriction endonuclease [Candidatus Saccharibacteria bacterium]|nr:restriction endonuclease [Candidatus Saccharibacteria bacterium]